MRLGYIQRCLFLTGTILLLLYTVSVNGEDSTLTASSVTRRFSHYLSVYMVRNEVNRIIINAPLISQLISFSIKSDTALNETQCASGGALKVYSGGYYVGSYCGGPRWETFAGSHSSMVLVLDYDLANAIDETTVSYQVQDGCGSGATAGPYPRYIRSPGYPNAGSARYKLCAWVGAALDNGRVRISIRFNQTSYNPTCSRSNVTIMDGENMVWDRRIIGQWCDGESTYVSWQDMVGIRAVGLQYLTIGFEIKIEAVTDARCEHTVDGNGQARGVIASPGYPRPYTDLLECRWKITSSTIRNIRIIVETSDIDPAKNCTEDNVKLYVDIRSSALKTWCGTQTPSYEFHTSVLYLVFKASSHIEASSYEGFQLRYEVSDEPECGRGLTAYSSDRELTTVGYPTPFHGYMQCKWILTALDPLKVVELHVIASDLYYGIVCNKEMVDVYDGPVATEVKRIGTFCGRASRRTYRSASHQMLIVFTSDRANRNRKGFFSKYRQDICGAELPTPSGSPGTVLSPGYPANYASGSDCFWNLTASHGLIGVRILDLDIPCTDDSLTIYDGSVSQSTRQWRLCGRGPHSYLSSTQDLFLHLKTQTNQGKGFNLTYLGYYGQGEVAGCQHYVATIYPEYTRATLHSPGYPGKYFDKLSCRYRFAASTAIKLEIRMKQMRKTGSRCGDYLNVYDGYDETADLLYSRLCEDDYTVTLVSTWRMLYVEFITDESDTGLGFDIHYQGVGPNIMTTTRRPYYSTRRPKTSGSINVGILVGGLTPTIIVIGIIVGVFIYVKCRYGSTSSRSNPEPYVPRISNIQRRNVNPHETARSNNRNTPSAPSNFDDMRPDPYAPPPSYIDINQYPSEGKVDDDIVPPPPSYTDAIRGGMIQGSAQNNSGSWPDTTYV